MSIGALDSKALATVRPAREEVIVPFPAARPLLGVASEVRSTLITSSLRIVRERDLLPRYTALLPRAHRDTILSTIAGVWLPMEVGKAHYRAMDGLGFSLAEQVRIGTEVGERVHGTFLGTMVKMAASAGVSPWTALGQVGKLYGRVFRGGGGPTVVKLGPKEARAELAGVPLAEVAYWRAGMRGMFQAGCELFCRKAYVTEVAYTPTTVSVRVAWA